MVFNATFNNISVISWRSVLFVKETGIPGEYHWHVASHWQTLSNNVVLSTCYISPWTEFKLTTLVLIDTDCAGCCTIYHSITTTPLLEKELYCKHKHIYCWHNTSLSTLQTKSKYPRLGNSRNYWQCINNFLTNKTDNNASQTKFDCVSFEI
jgi:hypothetical protein